MRKWIINNNELRMGNVEFHYELARDHSKTQGGGLWEWDESKKIVYFWGVSSDFGQASVETFKESLPNSLIGPFLDDCKFMFSAYPGKIETFENNLSLFEEIKREQN